MADEPDTTEQPNSPETEKPSPTEKPAEEAPVEKPAEDKPADEDAAALADRLKKEAEEGKGKSLMTGDKGPEDPDEDDEQDEVAELPEKYDLTPPEGFEVNDEILAEADPIFRDLKLTNEQANKLMPLAGTFAKRLFSAQQDAFQAQATDWAKTAKADQEIGGRNWQETETLVAKALDHFAEGEGGAKFRTLLDETKLGNHPEMIRMFRKIGVALSEDGEMPRSDAGAQVKQPREAVLYPEDAPKEGAN